MRVMLTGAGGFVAPHVLAAARGALPADTAWLLTSHEGAPTRDGRPTTALDVTDAAAAARIVRDFSPTHLLHLAGVTSLSAAAADARAAWDINLFGTLNLAQALAAHAPGAAFLFAGTALAYGDTARHGRPLTEDDLLRPQNDYAVTKSAADLALGAMAGGPARIVRLRPFNHTGPGQSESFVLPSFAAQVARIEVGRQAPVMRVGNLDVVRDFLDVSDVAEGYVLAMLKAGSIESGTVLNIASGVPRTVRSMLETLLSESRREIRVETDPARVRPNEIETFVGDAARARALIGWAPRTDFSDTIRRLLADARARLA